MTRGRKPRTALATPDRYEELKAAADQLVTAAGSYWFNVRQVVGQDGPTDKWLSEAIDAVARIIYREDEAA